MQIAMIAPAVEKLHEYFSSGTTRSPAWRRQQLKQLLKLIDDSQQAILQALKEDLGKAEQESWLSEVGYLQTDIRHSIKHLDKWCAPRKVSTPIVAQPGKSYLLPEPLGTVLIIGAWNYPFQLVLAPLVAAISAGNCAVLKPSELAPSTSALIARLLPQYLDTQAFLVVEGAVEETTELLRQPLDHILYTGGEAVGKIVMRAAAEHLTPVTLELGGKSPCVVASDCDLDVAAARIVWSKWMNAGQTCVAPDYILTEKRFSGDLIAALQKKILQFYGDDPATSPDYGRIINDSHFQRLQGYLSDTHLTFGGQTNQAERYIAPTLLLDPPLSSQVMQEEIFGPILPVITVENIKDTLTYINSRPKPLALYLYTRSTDLEQQILSQTSAGSVCVNDGMMFMTNPALPFGGVGSSGMGNYHGQWGFDTFSHIKSVMKRSNWLDINWRYPPFSLAKLKKLKWIS